MNWISVDDKLPDVGDIVLAHFYYDGEGKWHYDAVLSAMPHWLVVYDGKGNWFNWPIMTQYQDIKVSHWMKLPDPPKKETIGGSEPAMLLPSICIASI